MIIVIMNSTVLIQGSNCFFDDGKYLLLYFHFIVTETRYVFIPTGVFVEMHNYELGKPGVPCCMDDAAI